MEKKYDKELVQIGLKIKQRRQEKHFTQSSLAAMCDVDIRTIQRIEKGEHNMSVTIMFSLLTSLDLKPEDFFDNEEKMENIE